MRAQPSSGAQRAAGVLSAEGLAVVVKSSFRRALIVLRLIVLAGVANLGVFAMPGGDFVFSASAAAAAEQPPRAKNLASKARRVNPGDDDDDEQKASSDDGDDDDEDADDDCDDDDDNEDD
jgi:hypothetical protein